MIARRTSVAVLAMVLLVTGCSHADTRVSPAPKAANDGFVDSTGYAAALRTSYAAYRWPADYTPDLNDLARKSGPPPHARISAGGERTVLEIVNKCAWYLSWDAARTRHDAAAARKALDVMTTVLPAYGAGDPDGQQLAVETARRAALGDPAQALGYVHANCDATKFDKA